jgi:hypothetical protein
MVVKDGVRMLQIQCRWCNALTASRKTSCQKSFHTPDDSLLIDNF